MFGSVRNREIESVLDMQIKVTKVLYTEQKHNIIDNNSHRSLTVAQKHSCKYIVLKRRYTIKQVGINLVYNIMATARGHDSGRKLPKVPRRIARVFINIIVFKSW